MSILVKQAGQYVQSVQSSYLSQKDSPHPAHSFATKTILHLQFATAVQFGLLVALFAGHSFIIGATTTAKVVGMITQWSRILAGGQAMSIMPKSVVQWMNMKYICSTLKVRLVLDRIQKQSNTTTVENRTPPSSTRTLEWLRELLTSPMVMET